MNFFNESFYNEKFKSPNKEDYALKYKSQNKISNNPNYSHQFGNFFFNLRKYIFARFCAY